MKILKPKKEATITPIKRLTHAKIVLDTAKQDLKNFIGLQIPMLYNAFGWDEPDFSEGEDYIVPTGDLLNTVYINVEVDNSYLDVEDRCYEGMEVAEIRLALDGNVFVANENGDEFTWDELSVEELASIAEALELTYIKVSTEK